METQTGTIHTIRRNPESSQLRDITYLTSFPPHPIPTLFCQAESATIAGLAGGFLKIVNSPNLKIIVNRLVDLFLRTRSESLESGLFPCRKTRQRSNQYQINRILPSAY